MKTLPFHFATTLCILSFSALAGTIHLKDGTTLEGSVLREDGDSYVLLIKVTENIKDEKIIAKADVKKIVADQPDLIAFAEIEKFVPVPDLASEAEYQRRIALVETFIKDHRRSPKNRVAKELLSTLKEEANQIAAGGIKLRGKIIAPSEYRANAYELDAVAQEIMIRALVANGRKLEALRKFTLFDRDFRNTAPFKEILPLMRQVMISHNTEATQYLDTLEQRIEKRRLGLERMSVTDRAATERAIEEENSSLEILFRTEKDSKVGWVTPHPFSKAALQETERHAKQELSRMARLSNTPFVDAGKIYRETYQAIVNATDQASVRKNIQEARSARLPAKYMEILQTALAELPEKSK
jgi:hypothetical protein